MSTLYPHLAKKSDLTLYYISRYLDLTPMSFFTKSSWFPSLERSIGNKIDAINSNLSKNGILEVTTQSSYENLPLLGMSDSISSDTINSKGFGIFVVRHVRHEGYQYSLDIGIFISPNRSYYLVLTKLSPENTLANILINKRSTTQNIEMALYWRSSDDLDEQMKIMSRIVKRELDTSIKRNRKVNDAFGNVLLAFDTYSGMVSSPNISDSELD